MAQRKYTEQSTNIEYTESKARRFMSLHLKMLTYKDAAEVAAYAMTTWFGEVDFDADTRERFKLWSEDEFEQYNSY